MSNAGVLLVNLGTPDGTDYRSVRRYLSEFLSDPRVIEAPRVVWQPILQGLILQTRPRRSGAAYARIWNRALDESPLRTYTRRQAEALAERLAPDGVEVAWGMRYGSPSVAGAIEELRERGCDRIVLFPLYPQFSATTTATANDQAFRALMKIRQQPAIRTVPSFPDHPAYIHALDQSIRDSLRRLDWKPDMLVGSFHGLPQKYVQLGDPYQSECERTMHSLRRSLGIEEDLFPLTYQSRFGPAKWLQPYTAPTVERLARAGVRRIAVVMPGFMADCIETLDEIGNEVREDFIHAGGEQFTTLACLNDSDMAVDLIECLARDELQGWLEPGPDERGGGDEPVGWPARRRREPLAVGEESERR